MSDASSPTMKLQIPVLLLMAVFVCLPPSTAHSLEDVKIHVSGSTSFNSMIFEIGERRGYYKENGLTVLPIMATSQAGIQGLLGGSFDASQILGQSSTFILRGAPLKIVMVFDTKPLFWLFGKKGVKTLADFRSKRQVGVTSIGSSTDQMTREVLMKAGIDLKGNVVIQGTASGAVRVAALISGALDAAVLNPAERIIAKKNGLNELLFYGDQFETVAGGISVRESMLTEKTDYVRRLLRGSLKALLWFRANQAEASAMMAKQGRISMDDALEIYKATLPVFTYDGTMPGDMQQRIISFQKKQLKIDKDISPEQVYDFRILQSLMREMNK